jgi:DMSO/TMAO reductase YedYZ molybdopterin-dependent catalytic subunit
MMVKILQRALRLAILAVIMISVLANRPLTVEAAGATSTVRIVKYAEDGLTVLSDKQVSYEWMKSMLPVYGDGKTHYYHQGPIFEGDMWDPQEVHNLKDKGAVQGTAVKDLCDQVGGMSPGDEVSLVAVDRWHTNFAYSNIYQPQDRQGSITLCWYNGEDAEEGESYGLGYPGNDAFHTALQLVIMSGTASAEGRYVFGNTDMKITMPEEKYQHFYEGNYPSSNGLSGKWIAEIRIYSGGIKPGMKIDYTVADNYGTGTHITVVESSGPFPWQTVVLGAAGLLLLTGSYFLFRRQEQKALKKGALAALGLILIAVSSLVYFHPGQPSTADSAIDWELKLIGLNGQQKVLDMEAIRDLPSYSGKGGFFSTVGVVYGPWEAQGVPLIELCQLVGGIGPLDIVMVTAADGYSTVLDYDQVMGNFITYNLTLDAENKEVIRETPHGELKPILMYRQDGKPLTDDDGKPLRIAVIGAEPLLTEGNAWVKWVNKIEVLKVKNPG